LPHGEFAPAEFAPTEFAPTSTQLDRVRPNKIESYIEILPRSSLGGEVTSLGEFLGGEMTGNCLTRAEKGRAVKRAVRSWSNV